VQGFFVTGTDTDVGKTVISAWLVARLDGCYWKPVQAGNHPETDSAIVQRLTGVRPDRILPEAYVLPEPIAPHEAARRAEAEKRTVSDEALRQAREDAERRAQEERKARLDAEHQARRESERRAAAERRAQEDGEKMAVEAARQAKEATKAERRAREHAEKRAVEERKAREVAERRAREEATRRAAAEARARQEEQRREQERAARPPRKAPVVRRAKRREEPDAPPTKRSPADPDRPLQDEWGLFDPEALVYVSQNWSEVPVTPS